ncbi:unnamed protein product [Ceratitis capitata]|uniref:(Mediterranean fruit fly) hypothetical protein n=1 Tax=Ceratitis capitata TaxID=7213 RepID=W8BW29_CERCA|nr:unnamed protein product [Ceratitis capitata]
MEDGTLVLHKKNRESVKQVEMESSTLPRKGSVNLAAVRSATTQPSTLPSEVHSSILKTLTDDNIPESELFNTFYDDAYESDYSSNVTNASKESFVAFDLLNSDFLHFFESLPDIDEISEDIDSLSRSARTTMDTTVEDTDVGVFVDPLTGQVLTEKSSTPLRPESEVAVIADEEEEGEEEQLTEELQMASSISEDSEMLVLVENEELESKERTSKIRFQTTDDLENFLKKEIVTVSERQPSILDWERLEREKLYKQLKYEAEIFLDSIIKEVVKQVETRPPAEFLRNNLDKRACMNEILKNVDQLQIERTVKNYLNRKAAEYYRKKGLYFPITDELPEEAEKYKEKLKNATSQLDRALSLENGILARSEVLRYKSQTKFEELQKMVKEKELELRSLVQKTLVKDSKSKFDTTISELLDQISASHDEVCDVYLKLIQVQHTKADLQKKHDYIEYSLGMQRFVALQTETKDLQKKVEDRNVELREARGRCNRDIHTFSNMKVKTDIVKVTNRMRKRALANLTRYKHEIREKLVTLKEQRLLLQKEKRELTFQSGLLSKPMLLRDYDATVEKANATMNNVEALRKQQKDLLEKIAKLETNCNKEN